MTGAIDQLNLLGLYLASPDCWVSLEWTVERVLPADGSYHWRLTDRQANRIVGTYATLGEVLGAMPKPAPKGRVRRAAL